MISYLLKGLVGQGRGREGQPLLSACRAAGTLDTLSQLFPSVTPAAGHCYPSHRCGNGSKGSFPKDARLG